MKALTEIQREEVQYNKQWRKEMFTLVESVLLGQILGYRNACVTMKTDSREHKLELGN